MDADLHPIQEEVLKKLSYGREKTFSELKGDTPSNKLAFHLNKLQENQLIEKTENGYRVTDKGHELLPYFKLSGLELPIAVVDMLAFSGDKVFLKEKESDPLDPVAGFYRAPSARVSKNDRLKEKAREIFEKHFDGETHFRLAAVFESRISLRDGSNQHFLLYFFKTEVDADGDHWHNISDLDRLPLLPGLKTVIERLKDTDRILYGEWNIVEDNGFQVEKLEFQSSP